MFVPLQRIRPDLETLLAAVAGVLIFSFFKMPAAALSGAMVGVALLLVWGRPVRLMNGLRDLGMLISGVSMGSAVTPEMLQGFQRYPISLLIFAASLAVTMVLTQFLLRRFAGLDRETAFFASAPGALSGVLAVASETKADLVTVTMVQSFRLFVLVAVLPSIVVATGEKGIAVSQSVIGAKELLVLVVVGSAVSWCLARVGMAASWIFGGMIVSAVAHGASLVTGDVPDALMQMGFGLVGIYISTRFSFITKAVFFKTLFVSFWSFLLGLALAVLAAVLATWTTSVSFGQALVAYAPGGLEAMIILGVALGLDPLYVGLHHLLRFFGIALLIPLAVVWLKRST